MSFAPGQDRLHVFDPKATPTDPEEARQALRKQLTPLTLTEEEMHDLWGSIDRARARRKKVEETWKTLLKEYLPIVKPSTEAETLKVQAHFKNVHTKIGQIFYRSPQVQCIAKGPMLDKVQAPPVQPGAPPVVKTGEQVVAIKQAVLNWYLGQDCINVSRLMDECLFDVLAWAGIGCVKIGYRATLKMVEQPVMGPDPSFQPTPQPGGILSLVPQQPPMIQVGTKQVPVPIHEDWYARRFSPMKLLFNDDLASTRYDEEATWIGWEWFLPKDLAIKEFALTEDEASAAGGKDDRVYEHDDARTVSKSGDKVHGVELWRKASLFRSDQPHPQAIDHIVVVDGVKDHPVVARPSPDQTFDETGRLTPDSLIGFPIHIVTIRDLADSPYPPADSAFTNSQAKELNTHRRQTVAIRDAFTPKYLADAAHFEDAEVEQIKHGDIGEITFVKPGSLAAAGGARGLLDLVPQGQSAADSLEGAELIKQDMQETLGISAQTLGTPEATVRSATELAQMATSFAGRMEKEQRRAVDAFLGLARKVDALVMRYATETQYLSIAGQDGTRELVAWNNKVVNGRYAYDILPDSSWRIDAAQRLRLDLSLYNLAANDPLFNRAPVLRRIAQELGWDPRQAVLTPEQIQLQAMQGQAQPPHGGKAQPISTHEQTRTAATRNGPSQPGGPSRRIA